MLKMIIPLIFTVTSRKLHVSTEAAWLPGPGSYIGRFLLGALYVRVGGGGGGGRESIPLMHTGMFSWPLSHLAIADLVPL